MRSRLFHSRPGLNPGRLFVPSGILGSTRPHRITHPLALCFFRSLPSEISGHLKKAVVSLLSSGRFFAPAALPALGGAAPPRHRWKTVAPLDYHSTQASRRGGAPTISSVHSSGVHISVRARVGQRASTHFILSVLFRRLLFCVFVSLIVAATKPDLLGNLMALE